MTDRDPRELQEEALFLKRLARRLTTDEATADDLVQQVWLESLGTSIDADKRRAWLRSSLRNLAFRHFRSRRHRADRETLAAREREEQAVDSGAEQRSTREWLAQAVAELPGVSAEVLRLHYLENLALAEIAERLECPLGTVKGRLHRGLEDLRGRLRPRFESDRAFGLALIAAFDWEPEDLPAHLLRATTTVGVLGLLATWLPLVAVLALVPLAWRFFRSGQVPAPEVAATEDVVARAAPPEETVAPPEPDAPAPDPAQAAETTASRVEASPPNAGAGEAPEDAAPTETRMQVDVVVTDEDGAPLAGSRLSVGTTENGRRLLFEDIATTDGQGRASAKIEKGRIMTLQGEVLLAARRDDLAQSDHYFLRFRAGEVRELHMVQPGPVLALHGQVVDDAGVPIVGVLLQANEKQVFSVSEDLSILRAPRASDTDKDGKFSFRALARGTHRILATHPDYQPTIVTVDGTGRAEVDTTIRMQRGSRLVGVVRDSEGQPVPRASVHLDGPTSDLVKPVRTDKQGAFRLNNLPSERCRVWAVAGDLADVLDVELAAGEELQHDFRLSGDHTLRIRPVVEEGALEGAVVQAYTEDHSWMQASDALDEDGIATFPACPSGPIHIQVGDRRYRIAVAQVVVDGPAAEPWVVPCVVPQGEPASVQGRVAPRDQVPIGKQHVQILPRANRLIGSAVELDPTGMFSIDRLSPGAYDVHLAVEGLGYPLISTVTLEPGAAVDLGVLELPALSRLRVLWDWSADETEGVRWRIDQENVGTVRAGQGAPESDLELFPGRYQFFVVALDGERQALPVQLREGEVLTITSSPLAGRPVVVAVAAARSVQLEAWTLAVDEDGASVPARAPSWSGKAAPDASGRARFDLQLPIGRHLLRARDDAGTWKTTVLAVEEEPQFLEVSLALED